MRAHPLPLSLLTFRGCISFCPVHFSVIQHQLYLMSTGMTEREAYHAATQEFYLIRAQEETEARVAKAQAMAFGLKPRRSFVMTGLKREEEALLEAEKNASMF